LNSVTTLCSFDVAYMVSKAITSGSRTRSSTGLRRADRRRGAANTRCKQNSQSLRSVAGRWLGGSEVFVSFVAVSGFGRLVRAERGRGFGSVGGLVGVKCCSH
jgi:hypothetical protein